MLSPELPYIFSPDYLEESGKIAYPIAFFRALLPSHGYDPRETTKKSAGHHGEDNNRSGRHMTWVSPQGNLPPFKISEDPQQTIHVFSGHLQFSPLKSLFSVFYLFFCPANFMEASINLLNSG
jgi:hypothetical protein